MSQPKPLCRFLREEAALSAVEFALVLPIMLLLALGIAEIGRFTLLSLKLQHAADTMADLTSREPALSDAGLTALFPALQHVMAPFDLHGQGIAVVSNVKGLEGGSTSICWQRRGGGTLPASSILGKEGGAATLPAAMVLRSNETLITAELFFRYEPWLRRLVPQVELRRVAFFRPRLGSLCPLG